MFSLVLRARKLGAPLRTRPRARVLAAIGVLSTACAASTANHPEAARPGAGPSAANAVDERPRANATSPANGTSPPEASRAAPSAPTLAESERALAERATLPEISRVALARNPDLVEAQGRVQAARELAPAASRLPDPEFEYQLWAQPLARPHALDQAQMHMFGLRQAFPAPGTLGARARAALAQANVTEQSRRAREQDLVRRVRHAYAEYYRADREFQIHREHAELARQFVDSARAVYQGGRGTQQDVLRAGLEVSRLHNDLNLVDAARRTARGLLNSLMARPPDAPLGPPAPLEPLTMEQRLDRFARLLPEQRPEVAAARDVIAVRENELDMARASARWPSFMVGVEYMYMPPEREPHNYGVMFSMSLPWFNPAYGERVRAAEADVAAEKSALSSARFAARQEVYEAAERLRAMRESLATIERDLLPQAQQNLESAQAAYRGGQSDSLGVLDAVRSLFDLRLERERTLVAMEVALADLERATGTPIDAHRQDGGSAQ